MNTAYLIARKQPDGSPGQPVGNDEGAVMVFEEIGDANRVRNSLSTTSEPLSVFAVNLVIVGEVVS